MIPETYRVLPRWLPTGAHQQISGKFVCSLPKAHDHTWSTTFTYSRMGVFTTMEAQPSTPLPPLRSYSSLVPFGPLSFSSSVNARIRQRLKQSSLRLTIHADCLFAVQASEGLCSSKASSALTIHTRTDFVLLAQHIPIDIIHVSAHQGDIDNKFAALLANMARTCVASHSPSEWPHRGLDLTFPVSDDLVAERFWALVERCQDPMYSHSFLCVSSQEACHHCYSQCSHPAQVPDSDPSLFSARRCSRIEMQGDVCQVLSWIHNSRFSCDSARSVSL